MTTDTTVDHSTCASSGCGMLATHNRSTNGEGQWLCFIHFAADSEDKFHITAELTRLAWLVGVVRALRAGVKISDEMKKSFVLAQRTDLARKESEARSTWMIRLEGVLQQACKAAVQS